jgi:hypothetical protein
MTSSSIVSFAVTALNLVPLSIYFATRHRQEPAMKFLAIALVAHFFSDLIGTTTYIMGDGETSLVLSNLYSLLETVMIVLLFRVKFNAAAGRALLFLGVCLVALQLYQIGLNPGIFVFPIFSRMVISLAVTMLSILYFYKLINDLPAVHIYKVPMLWINIGLLVYFTGNFVLFTLKDYLADALANDLRFYWGYHNFLTGLSYILFSIGLLQASAARTIPSPHV